MTAFFALFSYIFFQGLGLILLLVSLGLFVYLSINKLHSRKTAVLAVTLVLGWFLFIVVPLGMPQVLSYPFQLHTYGPAQGPVMALSNVVKFFLRAGSFERVPDIARAPTDVPAPITRKTSEIVELHLTAKEVIAEVAPGVTYNYWTFDGTVPGPLLRVREGDTVKLTLENDPTNLHHHSIDLHAVTGPGGGAVVTNVAPGEKKLLTFKALNPGLYVYHCAHPNVAVHMAHGMYGLILVEPKNGLPAVDREFYVMQGELYAQGSMGNRGIQIFSAEKMLDARPEYVTFNGKVGGAVNSMSAKTGETVRLFVGNGGVNFISSFHVIGEIFDRVYPEAAIGSEPHRNIQTTLVPAGGASIVEFGLEVPGKNILVDHALARMDRGAWGTLDVTGENRKDIFDGVFDHGGSGH